MRPTQNEAGAKVKARPRIKVCGITRIEDALACAEAGVDAIGFVFYEPSPRNVSPEQAQEIIAALPPFITTVGLFVNAKAEVLADVCARVALDLVQFHGDEAPEFCAQYSPRPWIKALAMHDALDVEPMAKAYHQAGAQGVLLDAYVKGKRGGTGEAFDWERFPQNDEIPYILAGGLTPDNIRNAILQTQPWAVDLSSGVELSAGIKDYEAIQHLVSQTYIGATGV